MGPGVPTVASCSGPRARQFSPPDCVHTTWDLRSSEDHHTQHDQNDCILVCFLQQSFTHFKARYDALEAFETVLQALAETPSNKSRARHQKRREKILRIGHRLAQGSNILPPCLVHQCFKLPYGFISGARQIQQTAQIFFPLHVSVRRVYLHLCHLGLLPPALAKMQVAAFASSQGHPPNSQFRIGIRCPARGLVKERGAAMLQHFRSEHWDRDGQVRRRHFAEETFREMIEVLRPA